MAIFITRFTDGLKLGPRRFEIYRDLTKRAIKKLKEKMMRMDRSVRMNRSQSQSSITSIASVESLIDSENGQITVKHAELQDGPA